MDNSSQSPPGWYPDGKGGQAYWDGTAWVQSAPVAPSAAPAPAPAPIFQPVPPKKKSHLGLILGIVGLVLFLMVGGCVAAIAVGVKAATQPVDAANSWVSAIEQNNTTAAQALTCGAWSSDVGSLENFVFDGTPSSHNLNNVDIVNGVATVTGTVSYTNGSSGSLHMTVVQENGAWKVC